MGQERMIGEFVATWMVYLAGSAIHASPHVRREEGLDEDCAGDDEAEEEGTHGEGEAEEGIEEALA